VGTVFLGSGRSPDAARASEVPLAMLLPMALLATACLAIGLFPGALLPALAGAAAHWSGLPAAALAGPAAEAGASAGRISLAAALLLGLSAALVLWRRRRLPAAPRRTETWGCGYARPTARMQYTGSSFAEALVMRFGWALSPRAQVEPPRGLFPRRAAFHSSVPDTVLEVGILPALSWASGMAARHRGRLLGRVQFQALLLLSGLLALLAFLALG